MHGYAPLYPIFRKFARKNGKIGVSRLTLTSLGLPARIDTLPGQVNSIKAMPDIPLVLYHIYGYAVPIVILATLYGFRWKAGMWGNLLTLGAVLFAFLVAVGWWEDVAGLLAGQASSLLFVADCVAFWTLFIITLLILDTATRFLSTIKVKYAEQVENIGNGAVLFVLFLALYGTFLFAEEIGPVGEHANVTVPADSTMVQTTIQMLRQLSTNNGGWKGNLSSFTNDNMFDRYGEFRQLHLERRQALMDKVKGGGSIQYEGTVPERKR